LIAPVVTEGDVTRKVYLPVGEWFDWHDEVAHTSDSGQWLEVHAPLEKLPIFVKGGSIIPTWFDAPKSLSGALPSEIELRVWIPTEDGVYRSALQEDDGLTFGWAQSEFVRTDFILERHGASITIRGNVSGNGYLGFNRQSFVFKFLGENGRNLESIRHTNTGESFELTVEVI
jgi:alpha-glucosidase